MWIVLTPEAATKSGVKERCVSTNSIMAISLRSPGLGWIGGQTVTGRGASGSYARVMPSRCAGAGTKDKNLGLQKIQLGFQWNGSGGSGLVTQSSGLGDCIGVTIVRWITNFIGCIHILLHKSKFAR